MLNELGVHTVEDLFTQRHLLARVFSPTMFDFLMRVSDEANNPSATFEPHGPVRLRKLFGLQRDAMWLRIAGWFGKAKGYPWGRANQVSAVAAVRR